MTKTFFTAYHCYSFIEYYISSKQFRVKYSRHLESLQVSRKYGATCTNNYKSLRSFTADRYEDKTQDIALSDNTITDIEFQTIIHEMNNYQTHLLSPHKQRLKHSREAQN